jgi:hypothetical protein
VTIDDPAAYISIVPFRSLLNRAARRRHTRITAIGHGAPVHLAETARLAAIAKHSYDTARAAGCDCAPTVTLALDDQWDTVMAIDVIHAADCPRSRQLGAPDN